ncbi:MAG TPA: hypothetical protein VMB48_05350, partial [Steroidobacteraceae bacterium]|nr:hypothetical protein [Steroidobacteraceae bacterium]
MLARIAGFEIRYQLRSPLFIIAFAIFFLLTFGSVTSDQIRIGAAGNVNLNSPYAIALTVATLSIFATFVSAAFVANVIVRDDESGFAPLVRSTRITKADYLLGRFSGAFVVAALVLASVPLGMLVGTWMPWLDREKVGPFVAAHYLFAYGVLGLPSVLVSAAAFFALATATRSMMWTYVGVVAFVVLYVVSRQWLSDPTKLRLSALSDPYGVGAFSDVTRYWTAAERNTRMPQLAGVLALSRLLWVGVSAGLFGLAWWLFRFEDRGAAWRAGTPAAAPAAPAAIPSSPAAVPAVPPRVPLVPPRTAPEARAPVRQAFLSLTRFDMRFVFGSPAFFVLLALGMLNALGALGDAVTRDDTDYFPVTRIVIDLLRGAFTIIPIIIAIYYAGELVWRDAERRMQEIVGATPAPDWAFVIPKVLAIALVLLATELAGVGLAAGFQLWHHYTHLQPGR